MLSKNALFSISSSKWSKATWLQSISMTKSVSVALTLGMGLAVAAPVSADAAKRPEFPVLRFADKARGAEAIRRLGNKLPDVAAWYRMAPEKLAAIFRQDQNAWLDESGRLLYIDEYPETPDFTDAVNPSATTSSAAPYPLETTFQLHSKPGSNRVLYLDFNGHTKTGSAWNAGTINADPFDLDGMPGAFSATEQERIQYIWQRVAEDYAPFDVDVTTEEPSADLLNRTSSGDQQFGSRVVITRNNFGVCNNCGGVAYVGVFDYYSRTNPEYYQPAWVFFDALGGGNEKYVAEAISHEAGHNLGLSHDGTSASAYYAGHGSGPTGWAPIMGVGYYQELVQWSKGEYPDANNQEDDIAIIQAHGAKLKPDDVGNDMASAVPLAGSVNGNIVTVNKTGLIEQGSDSDYFSVVTGEGPLQVSVTPAALGPNLHASLELLDAAGVTLASASSADALSASLNLNVPAGNYFIKVDGVGKGDLSTGYSDYGSLGNYILDASYAASTAMAPEAVANASVSSGYAPLSVDFSSLGSTDSDGTIVEYFWDFGDGFTATEANPSHTYNNVGTFYPTLTVTDSQGLKSTDSLTITVTQDPTLSTMHVDNIILTYSRKARTYQCVADVSIKNANGGAVLGANVTGSWSGVSSSGLVSATTNSSGIARFSSPKTREQGTCTFTVNDVALAGWSYDQSQNVESTDSLTY